MNSSALAILARDIKAEFRTRYALNALLMFALVTLTAVAYTIAGGNLSAQVQSALLWIVIFFSSMTGLARSFVVEEDAHTAPYLRIYAQTGAVFWGKLLANLLLIVALTVIAFPLYLFLMGISVGEIWIHMIGLVLGLVGFSGGSTIVAAIVAQSSSRGALFTALSFPIMLPILALVIDINAVAFEGGTLEEVLQVIGGLTAYIGALITASWMLFDHVWRG